MQLRSRCSPSDSSRFPCPSTTGKAPACGSIVGRRSLHCRTLPLAPIAPPPATFQDDLVISRSDSPILTKNFSEKGSIRPGSINFSGLSSPVPKVLNAQSVRVFTATWNVAGKSPYHGLDLTNFLHAGDRSDIYVLGFQEIVPLNAGNVLVMENNEPAAKWLYLINQALNKPQVTRTTSCPNTPLYYKDLSSPEKNTNVSLSRSITAGSILSFQKPSLESVSKTFRFGDGRQIKACNCSSKVKRKIFEDSHPRSLRSFIIEDDSSKEEREFAIADIATAAFNVAKQQRYSLVASKQMVGIFVTVWERTELVQHISHLKLSCVCRGMMGYLGNKTTVKKNKRGDDNG